MTAISMAIAATTNPTSQFLPFVEYQLVDDHDAAIGIDPEHELVGRERLLADQHCPAQLALWRVRTESDRLGQEAAAGLGPRSRRFTSAANTVAVSANTCPGSLSAGTSQPIRAPNLTAACQVATSTRNAARTAPPAPTSSSSTLIE